MLHPEPPRFGRDQLSVPMPRVPRARMAIPGFRAGKGVFPGRPGGNGVLKTVPAPGAGHPSLSQNIDIIVSLM